MIDGITRKERAPSWERIIHQRVNRIRFAVKIQAMTISGLLHTAHNNNVTRFWIFRGSNGRYRSGFLDIPRRTRIGGSNMIALPRTTYYSSDRDLPAASYARSRSAAVAGGDPIVSQGLMLRDRAGDNAATRVFPRSTVAPDTSEKRKPWTAACSRLRRSTLFHICYELMTYYIQ